MAEIIAIHCAKVECVSCRPYRAASRSARFSPGSAGASPGAKISVPAGRAPVPSFHARLLSFRDFDAEGAGAFMPLEAAMKIRAFRRGHGCVGKKRPAAQAASCFTGFQGHECPCSLRNIVLNLLHPNASCQREKGRPTGGLSRLRRRRGYLDDQSPETRSLASSLALGAGAISPSETTFGSAGFSPRMCSR